MDFFQSIYGVLIKPNSTFKELSYEYNAGLLTKAAAVFIITEIIASQMSLPLMFDSLLYTFMVTSLISLVVLVFRKREEVKFWKLFALLVFANLPYMFLGPINVLAMTSANLASMLEMALMIWSFSLGVTAISIACDIRRSKVILLYAIPIIAILAFMASALVQLMALL